MKLTIIKNKLVLAAITFLCVSPASVSPIAPIISKFGCGIVTTGVLGILMLNTAHLYAPNINKPTELDRIMLDETLSVEEKIDKILQLFIDTSKARNVSFSQFMGALTILVEQNQLVFKNKLTTSTEAERELTLANFLKDFNELEHMQSSLRVALRFNKLRPILKQVLPPQTRKFLEEVGAFAFRNAVDIRLAIK